MLSAAEEHDELCRKDAEEHAQRINCRIADGGSLTRADAVGVSKCWRIGTCTGNHTHDGEIVELELQTGNHTNDKDGDDGSRSIMLADVVV